MILKMDELDKNETVEIVPCNLDDVTIDFYVSTDLSAQLFPDVTVGTIKSREAWLNDMGYQIEQANRFCEGIYSDYKFITANLCAHKCMATRLSYLQFNQLDEAFDIMIEHGFFKEVDNNGNEINLTNFK